MKRVQQTKIYKSRQLSWSVWHHRARCVLTASPLFTQDGEDAALLPGHEQHTDVNVFSDIDLIFNS